jgi:hypothetical protein
MGGAMAAKKDGYPGQLKEKLPMYTEVEFESKNYKYRVWKEFSPSQDREVVCASGPSEDMIDIQIPRMFGCQSLEEVRNMILCGFKNRKTDRQKRGQ